MQIWHRFQLIRVGIRWLTISRELYSICTDTHLGSNLWEPKQIKALYLLWWTTSLEQYSCLCKLFSYCAKVNGSKWVPVMGENKGRINAPAVSRVNKSALVRACDEGKKYAGKLICAHTLFLNSAVPFIMISVFWGGFLLSNSIISRKPWTWEGNRFWDFYNNRPKSAQEQIKSEQKRKSMRESAESFFFLML